MQSILNVTPQKVCVKASAKVGVVNISGCFQEEVLRCWGKGWIEGSFN